MTQWKECRGRREHRESWFLCISSSSSSLLFPCTLSPSQSFIPEFLIDDKAIYGSLISPPPPPPSSSHPSLSRSNSLLFMHFYFGIYFFLFFLFVFFKSLTQQPPLFLSLPCSHSLCAFVHTLTRNTIEEILFYKFFLSLNLFAIFCSTFWLIFCTFVFLKHDLLEMWIFHTFVKMYMLVPVIQFINQKKIFFLIFIFYKRS